MDAREMEQPRNFSKMTRSGSWWNSRKGYPTQISRNVQTTPRPPPAQAVRPIIAHTGPYYSHEKAYDFGWYDFGLWYD